MERPSERYPLTWPTGWKRAASRHHAKFSKRRTVTSPANPNYSYQQSDKLSVGDATRRLTDELRRLGARDVLISSNLRTRLDGLPVAGQATMLKDPGVAVYFKLRMNATTTRPLVLACDKWLSVADNIAAIAGHIEAMRTQERYGVGSLEQAFLGYAALPANTAADWRSVFGFKGGALVTPDMVNDRFQEMARTAHPDAGGSHEQMARLTEARAFARKELGA